MCQVCGKDCLLERSCMILCSVQSKPKTKPDKKKLYKEELVGVAGAQDGALDDPLAEKMRRQRYVSCFFW